MPHAEFQYDGFLYVANGESLNIKEFDINRAKSSKGIYIEEVKYYFDGKQIATSNSYPFSMDYPIQNQTIGEHTLKIVSKVKGEGYTDTDFLVCKSSGDGKKYNIYLLIYPLDNGDYNIEIINFLPPEKSGEQFSVIY